MANQDAHHLSRIRRRRLAVTVIAAVGLTLLLIPAAQGSEHDQGVSSRGQALPVASQRDLAEVRAAVARFSTPDRAEDAGWELLEDLDACFELPGQGGMGYHYIDADRLVDPTLDPLRPEALVFVPGPEGQLRLGAVEYIVPVELWDEPEPPSVLGAQLHRLEPVPGTEVWGLHVWLFERNPDGMFADWNPRVSC